MADQLKKQRQPVRGSFSRAVSELKVLLEAVPLNHFALQLKFTKVSQVYERLKAIDRQFLQEILEQGITDEAYTQEEEAMEVYDDEWREVSLRVDMVKQKSRPSSPAQSIFSTAQSQSTLEKKKSYKLPKVELKKFGGEVTDWLSFWSQFGKIHEDEDLHPSDKFQYLHQSTIEGSKARELVDSYPQTSENYPKVIQALKERYGNPRSLKRIYVRELLQLVITNSVKKVTVSQIYDKLESHLRALESLNVTMDMMDVLLFPLVESCLPSEVLVAWQRSSNFGRNGSKEVPPKTEFEYLLLFIKNEVENEQQRTFAQTTFGFSNREAKKDKKTDVFKKESKLHTAAALLSVQGQSLCCIFCGKPHLSEQCGRATSMPIHEKEGKVRESKSCFFCLKKGHGSRNCKAFLKCPICNKRHYALLCPELPINQKKVSQEHSSTEVVATNLNCSNSVLLKTLVVGSQGSVSRIKLRVLLDEGSQRSYIREETARKLNLKPIGTELMKKSLFGGRTSETRLHHKYYLTLENLDGSNSLRISVIDEPTLCGRIPCVPEGPWIKELGQHHIDITDLRSSSQPIDVVIGSDHWGEVVKFNGIRLQCGLVAMETRLGWTLSGPLSNLKESVAMTVTNVFFVENISVSALWDLQTIGIQDPIEAITKLEKQQRVSEHFYSTVTRNLDGRYSVCLPWVDGQRQRIPSNRAVAEKRLVSTTNKLNSTGFYQKYQEVFDLWEKEGILEVVTGEEDIDNFPFLPHRAVIKPGNLTTPVRPVFDASCKVGRNPSLNDCLEKGPNLMELIPSVLLRFREKSLGVTSDIRKAFQMIEVVKEDRRYLRFLWWNNSIAKQVKVYEHKRVVFGVNSSPFLLQAVLQRHLSGVEGENKPVAEKLLRSLYVDNCVTSVDSVYEYFDFRKKATKMMEDAKMELRQWECTGDGSRIGSPTDGGCGLESGSSSQSSSVSGKVWIKQVGKLCEYTGDGSRIGFPIDGGCRLDSGSVSSRLSSVLGLKWDKEEDTLGVDIDLLSLPSTITKRAMLSHVHRVFDPIGFLCPATLQPKLILQELWAAKIGWDEEVPYEVKKVFKKWASEIYLLNNVKIPRHLLVSTETNGIQIHSFVDASQLAYAAVVFIRSVKNGEVEIHLAQAKSRISPLKRGTIPRLELMAALIGTRLTKSTKEALEMMNVPTHYWSDSTTTLSWIKRNNEWGTFVGNRVKEILSYTQAEEWKFVPGTMNPADLPSRGCSPSQLLESKWWEGPTWLKHPTQSWPSSSGEVNEDEVAQEKKKTIVVVNQVKVSPSFFQTRFNSYFKNVRVMAWVRRFIVTSRSKGDRFKSKFISVQELRQAELDVVRVIQSQSFPNKTVQIGGIAVSRLEDGLFHVKSKLLNKQDTLLFRWPIILPSSHPLVEAMILEIHRIHGHIGTQSLLGKTRERFWVLQGRKTVRKVLRRCINCRRHEAKGINVDPAALPQKRVSLSSPFETTGVDLAGPLFLKNGKKVWVVLYTCAVYRGVHLDLVSTLSTEGFLNSLERFINFFGRPKNIFSDNGTNFVGAVNLFKQLNWNKIEKDSGVSQINWIFNPPTAAWWGGWWERLVRTLKDLLKRMIGNARLSEENLRTCLSSVEAALNDRPLTTLTEDPDDLLPLTPSMLFRGFLRSRFPEGAEISSQDLRDELQFKLKLQQELQGRFRKEYLAQLVQRAKEKKTILPRVGDIVLIGADNKKRLEWPMGRIIQLIPGKDGIVRVAKVKTRQGILVRPLQRIFPLEVSRPEDSPIFSNKAHHSETSLNEQEPKSALVQPVELSRRTRVGRIVKMPQKYL